MNDRVFDGYLVTETLTDVHTKWPEYELLTGTLVLKSDDDTWRKEAPGLAIVGLELTPEQEATLQPVKYLWDGHLGYQILEEQEDVDRQLKEADVLCVCRRPECAEACQYPVVAQKRDILRERLDAAKRALIDTGYFKAEEVGDDIAPRITELYLERKST